MTNNQRIFLSLGCIALAALSYALMPVIKPFLIALLLAYLADPLVERMQRWHLPRTLAVIVVFLLLILLCLLLLGFLIPRLEKQIVLLISNIPTMIAEFQRIGLPWLNQTLDTLHLTQYTQTATLKNLFSQHWQQASGYLTLFWQTLSHSSLAIIEWIINLLLIPVVTFYLLRDFPLLLTNIKTLLPRRFAPMIIDLFSQCDAVLGAFFKGQLLVMLALATLYSLGLTLVGLPLALLIGLTAGLLSIVPYLGFTIGLISAIIACLIQFHDTWHLVAVLVVFLIGNGLEGMVLTPWLVGDKIGLHPVAVIFAILAGGQLAGFIGILVALPVAAVLMVLLRNGRRFYLQG